MFFEWIEKIKPSIILAAILIFIHVGFGGSAVAGAQTSLPEKKLEGRIRVSGAWALYPMMVTWAEEFKKIHPGVRIDISAGGAGKGVTDALSGLVDIGMVSRDLRPEELKQKAFYVPVVKDAVFPTINAANPVLKELTEKGLSKKDFINLWLSGRSMIWGDVTKTDNHRKIRVYTRSDSCGAAEPR
jgi:phosphate transport system substrate-binding protein